MSRIKPLGLYPRNPPVLSILRAHEQINWKAEPNRANTENKEKLFQIDGGCLSLGYLYGAVVANYRRRNPGKNQRELRRHLRLHGADLGRQGSEAFRKAWTGSQPRLHLRRAARYYVAHRRQRAIRQSFRHARSGSLPTRRRHSDDRVADEPAGAFARRAKAKSMFYLLSRANPEIPSGNPEGFADARFVNELESAGFFDELNRQYGK